MAFRRGDRSTIGVLFDYRKFIGLVGFEPTASWSRTRRSTKLSHSPKLKNLPRRRTLTSRILLKKARSSKLNSREAQGVTASQPSQLGPRLPKPSFLGALASLSRASRIRRGFSAEFGYYGWGTWVGQWQRE